MTSKSPTTDFASVEVGSVVRAHGLGGEVIVYPLSDVPERFARGSRLNLVGRDGARRTVTVRASERPAPEKVVLAFEGVDDRDAAEALRGARLVVDRAAVPAAPAGAYWHFELLGCRAFDERAGELGEVVEVTDAGGGPLLVVARADGSLLPLPFVDRFLIGVDLARRRIDWRLPEGLIEACASRS